MERPNIWKGVVSTFLTAAMIIGTVVFARAEEARRESAREDGTRHTSHDGEEKHEKWMTGDWHQHTFFTDGTNFMGDVKIDLSTTPPTFTILNGADVTDPKAVFPAGTYKGVIPQGFRYGLDFQANSEHGGNRGSRDGFGRRWNDTAFYPTGITNIPLQGDSGFYRNACSYLTVDSPGCTPDLPTPGAPVMWRWQELANYPFIISNFGDNYMSAFDWIETLRGQFPGKEILTGMEWNVPAHEHASTGCLDDNGKCIAEFEYRFDQNDTDMSGPTAAGMTWNGKIQTSAYTVTNGYPDYSAVLGLKPAHNKAIDGLAWLNANHPYTAWVNPAHIERAGCGKAADSGYSIAAIRDMNDTAPTVFFGFEGMPGHQKASNRGEFSSSACGGGTYGGAGTYIASVGGVWDALLRDGRKIFNFVSSDFHMTQDDFYPGEYAKTYVKVKAHEKDDDGFTQLDIVDAMRSGNSFAVHGDLVNELDFRIFHGAAGNHKAAHGMNSATMGETLAVEEGDKITVRIRFRSPATDNHGDVPSVHHVQLIQGVVNPPSLMAPKFVSGQPNPDFNVINRPGVDPVAIVAQTFDASNWNTDAEGYTTMSFTVKDVRSDLYFRIRGTNLGYGVNVVNASGKTIYGTDVAGNPLKNTPGTNTATEAWKDLWFYSNPIFVKVMERE